MRLFILFFSRLAVPALLCAGTLFAAPVSAQNAYTRVYVENRCYHTAELAVEREKSDMALPSVPPRSTEMVLFTLTKNIVPEQTVRIRRYGAEEKRQTVREIMDAARKEQWVIGRHTVTSWFVTLCEQEYGLDDPAGATVRTARPEETVAEYEILFSRLPGSSDPMYVYAGYPVRVVLNGIPLRVITTGRDGVLRVLLPPDIRGAVTLEAAQGGSSTMELEDDWKPARVRKAAEGEKVLMLPAPVSKGKW